MITITKSEDLRAAYFSANKHDGAQSTSRKFPSQYHQENMQEWTERCKIRGVPAKIFYMLEHYEATIENAAYDPCDFKKVSRIEIAEKYKDGNYEEL